MKLQEMLQKKAPRSLLGLTFEGRKIECAHLKRDTEGLLIQASASKELSLDPLADDPELVGRELRGHLDEAGIHERQVAVGIPLEWALTHLVELPEMPEEHLDGFIDLQAEKCFPFAPSDLAISISRFETGGEKKFALLTAVPLKHLDLLNKALLAAHLKPVSLSLGILALQEAQGVAAEEALTLLVSQDAVSILVSARGQTICLRQLRDVFETDEGPARRIDAHAVAKELRITLGQLPPGIRQSIKRLAVYGSSGLATTLVNDIAPKAENLGLKAEVIAAAHLNGSPLNLPIEGSMPPSFALAARYLTTPEFQLEYLPPHVSPLIRWAEKAASRKAGLSAGIFGSIAGVTLLAFLWQGFTLSRLESKWKGMEEEVEELKDIQGQIQRYRSWHDASQPHLKLMAVLSEAFPENSSITAKTVEIKNRNQASVSGTARNWDAVLAVTKKLGQSPNVKDLKTEQGRGTSPMTFNFSFSWQQGGSSAK